MNLLICKLGATGDVVRTSPLLRVWDGDVTWITAAKNTILLDGVLPNCRCLSWEEREKARDRRYDLVINLEDTDDVASFASKTEYGRLFGAYLRLNGTVSYTDDAKDWFDLSLISSYGKECADGLKLQNRRSYQELIFSGLGLTFKGQAYILPNVQNTELTGDVVIAPAAGPVWPMKNWAYYAELKIALEAQGLVVNILPQRKTLLEHMGDIQGHRVLVGGDSLPMHLALGLGVRCVSLFTCTSPWEIFDYGLQTKMISPLLARYFYQRGYESEATTAIPLADVFEAVVSAVEKAKDRTAVLSPQTVQP